MLPKMRFATMEIASIWTAALPVVMIMGLRVRVSLPGVFVTRTDSSSFFKTKSANVRSSSMILNWIPSLAVCFRNQTCSDRGTCFTDGTCYCEIGRVGNQCEDCKSVTLSSSGSLLTFFPEKVVRPVQVKQMAVQDRKPVSFEMLGIQGEPVVNFIAGIGDVVARTVGANFEGPVVMWPYNTMTTYIEVQPMQRVVSPIIQFHPSFFESLTMFRPIELQVEKHHFYCPLTLFFSCHRFLLKTRWILNWSICHLRLSVGYIAL